MTDDRERLELLVDLLRRSKDMMSAWSNGVCPEGVSLDKECPKCNVKCNVYCDLDSEIQVALSGGREADAPEYEGYDDNGTTIEGQCPDLPPEAVEDAIEEELVALPDDILDCLDVEISFNEDMAHFLAPRTDRKGQAGAVVHMDSAETCRDARNEIVILRTKIAALQSLAQKQRSIVEEHRNDWHILCSTFPFLAEIDALSTEGET